MPRPWRRRKRPRIQGPQAGSSHRATSGSPVPPLPARVRLEYSSFTDAHLPRFRAFIRMLRKELEPYPGAIVTKLDVQHLFIRDDFTFRGAGVAGQGFSWLPRASLAYGIRTFDAASPASQDVYRRTIHHEVFHLMDGRFSVAGGPIHGANWDDLNEPGFLYKVGRPNAPDPLSFYADNARRQGFAEPYGMNVATDDRVTLYARLVSGDIEFLGRVRRDPILTAKVVKICDCFRLLARDLEIPASNPLFEKLQSVEAMVVRQEGEPIPVVARRPTRRQISRSPACRSAATTLSTDSVIVCRSVDTVTS